MNGDTVFFRAPWSKLLTWLSVGSTGLLFAVAALQVAVIPHDLMNGVPMLLAATLPIATLLVCALYTIRGYAIEREAIYVQRLVWRTEIPLTGLQRAWAAPDAMGRSLRLFGNGGLFSISGLFRSQRLGRYRAFATDPKLAVVLEFATRKVVLTPDSPSSFLEHLRHVAPKAQIDAPPDGRPASNDDLR